jgi:hypothetical protein
MAARHHHYLSQCYLKGFTKGNSKKSKLTVIDFQEKKTFETIPRNVGGIRDFNRIDIKGFDPNTVEDSWAEFEGHVAIAIKEIQKDLHFEGEIKDSILSLIGLIAVRSPEQRENWRQFHAQIAERVMALSISSKKMYEDQIRRMKADGIKVANDVSYDDMKDFIERKGYEIKVAREHHIHMELLGLEKILPLLYARNWLVLNANEQTGPFITTDKPVNLTWNDSDSIPHFRKSSPGFGLNNTQLYFPVSKYVALLGKFDGNDDVIEVSKEIVSTFNSMMLMSFYKQIYSPTLKFFYLDTKNKYLDGNSLLGKLKSQHSQT